MIRNCGNPLGDFVRAVGPANPFRAPLRGLEQVQRNYVLDPDPIVMNHAARRAGKSRANGVSLLLPAAANPGGLAFFAAKDSKTARRIIWQTLRELHHEFKLGLEFNTGENTVVAPNGYTIWLLGLNDDGEADKLRGSTHGLVHGIIDECSTIRDDVLRYSVLECALPALGENDGRLMLSGTPGPLMSGFFYEQCIARGAHHWDARQNPHLKAGGQRYLEKALKNNPGWTWSTPTFQREYLGLWCEDRDMLVFPYLPARNLIYEGSEFPLGRTILGVDVGFTDGNGFTVSRSQPPHNPEIHILESYEKRGQTLPTMAAEIEFLRRHYSVNYIFVDEGNNGQMVAETLRGMGIPCQATPKGLKRPRIEVVRGGLAAGTIKVVRGRCDTLIGEWGIIPWNEKRTDMDERYSNECSDSCIYSILSHRGHYEALLNEPAAGSVEHMLKFQSRDKEIEERESISEADVQTALANIERTRGRVQGMRTVRGGYVRGR